MDSESQAVLDRLAAAAPGDAAQDDAAWLATFRDTVGGFTQFQGEAEPLHEVRELALPGPDAAVPARLYRPAPGVLPALLWFHGGGFVAGTLDTHDRPLRRLAVQSGWAVLSVAYRLAPEHPFPAAQEDCFAALRQAAGQAAALGLDPNRLAVGGDSCGGLLAAAVAIMARDRGGPALRLAVSLYPNTDLREERDHPSLREHDGKVVKLDELHRGLRLFLPPGANRTDARASPLLAPDLRGLPPTLVVTCEADPLRDEGERYAARLRAAGVAVRHSRHAGTIHGAFQMHAAVSAGRRMIEEVAAALRAA